MSNNRLNLIHNIIEHKSIKNDKNVAKLIADFSRPNQDIIEMKQHHNKQFLNYESIFSVNCAGICIEKGIHMKNLLKLRQFYSSDINVFNQELYLILRLCELDFLYANRINDINKMIELKVNNKIKYLNILNLLELDDRINNLKRIGINSDYKLF